MNYIRSHWQGNQSLAWSFWVNLVAMRIVILYFERFTHPPFLEEPATAIALTFIYFTIFQLIVYPWQIMGLLRACDRYLSEQGSYMFVLLAQFAMVLSLLGTLIYVLGAFQALFANPAAMIINQRKPSPPLLGPYTLTLTDEGSRIHLSGDFRLGVTQEMASLLEQHPGVQGIIFSSNGGRVTEGRGVARLIKKGGLDTYVFEICKSACTTAFIAGATRNLGPTGKLGFHQFAMDSKFKTPYIDHEAEQMIDLTFYKQQNIDAAFLQKVFKAPNTGIWFPTLKELLEAGVVDRILAAR
ncbi:MAG: hypothetical protein HQ513_04280 [Rhodospirillales bacterium]|nr:hypothetical protein [Rhodospirillales bacterium]